VFGPPVIHGLQLFDSRGRDALDRAVKGEHVACDVGAMVEQRMQSKARQRACSVQHAGDGVVKGVEADDEDVGHHQ